MCRRERGSTLLEALDRRRGFDSMPLYRAGSIADGLDDDSGRLDGDRATPVTERILRGDFDD